MLKMIVLFMRKYSFQIDFRVFLIMEYKNPLGAQIITYQVYKLIFNLLKYVSFIKFTFQ